MIELLVTSFPVIIQYFLLKRRGEAISVWTMKTAVFLWLLMAVTLFFVVFYFHPKSYSGLVPFRTISVVAQASGPVVAVHVKNGQAVNKGDLLFRIEDSAQRAALAQADAEFNKIAAIELKAQDQLAVAEAAFTQAEASLAQQAKDLDNAETLFDKGVVSADKVRSLRSAVTIAEAQVTAARAQLDAAINELTDTIPAQRQAAQAAQKTAQVALDKTQVRAFSNGVVTQLAMSVGSPASQLIISPAMVIIPDRQPGEVRQITAGFHQVAHDALHVGMPAEVACESNSNITFENAILPARVVAIQPAIATGQVVPSGTLLSPRKNPDRGSILVYLELLHAEHAASLLDGSGCLVQTYTNTIGGVVGHVIAATGVVKAAGLRLKAWGTLFAGVGLAGGSH